MVFPTSVAIIPDGNRRFAQARGLSLDQAYLQGFQKVRQVMDWVVPTGIQTTTLWALSLENITRRSRLEVRVLFELIKNQLDDYLADLPESAPHIRFIGRTDLLPEGVVSRMKKLDSQTSMRPRLLNVAVAYSGRDELVFAAKMAALAQVRGEISEINEQAIERYLYQPQPVDLLIRTGGVQRTSGFLPWQNAYAEVYFSKKLWPAFTRQDFKRALSFYENTERRFGK